MQQPVDEQRLKDYQARITSWIGRQGLLFQVRYFGVTGGASLTKRLLTLFVTLIVFALIFLGGVFLLFKFYLSSGDYRAKLDGQLTEAFGASEMESKGFARVGGTGKYKALSFTGGPESFFYNAKFGDIEAPFSFFTGVLHDWDPKTVTLKKAELHLKAGGTEDEMKAALSRVVESLDGESFTRLKIEDFSCEWGYSKLTFGGLYNTRLDAVLISGEWEITINGGYFRQNWLGPLAIDEGLLKVGPRGIDVDSLKLTEGAGSLSLKGNVRGPLNMPEIDLKGQFSRMPIDKLIQIEGVVEKRFIEGPVSGELQVSGSTNRRIKTSGRVVLDEEKGDEIRIRDEWRLLRAISAVARDGTYLRISFGSGSFNFVTEKGGMEVTDVALSAEGIAKLEGGFSTRLPTQQEAADRLGISLTDGFSSALTDTAAAQKLEDDRISIRRAAGDSQEGFGITLDIGDEDKSSRLRGTPQELDGLRLKREMSKHRFSGILKLGLPEAIFADNVKVSKAFLPDAEGWSWIPVNLSSVKFTDISREAGENLLEIGKSYKVGDSEPDSE